LFNLQRVQTLQRDCHDVKVIVPISLTPKRRETFPIPSVRGLVSRLHDKLRQPGSEIVEGCEVTRVKRISPPYKYFWHLDSAAMHLFNGYRIRKVIQKFVPDFIVASGLNPEGAYCRYIRRYSRIPFFVILEGSDIMVSPLKYRGIHHILEELNQADGVIFVSNGMAEQVLSRYDIRNTTVIRNGYNQEMFSYPPQGRALADRNNVRLLSIGGLNRIKGHDILIDAMKRLGNNYSLTLVGEGEKKEEYQNAIAASQIKATIIGFRDQTDVRTLMWESDFLCMPSRSESFGISAVEAMATGLPVIGSNVGGIKDLVIDNFNGFLFQNESSEDLSRRIQQAVDTVWIHEDISKQVRDSYSWDRWSKSLLSLYRSEKDEKFLHQP